MRCAAHGWTTVSRHRKVIAMLLPRLSGTLFMGLRISLLLFIIHPNSFLLVLSILDSH